MSLGFVVISGISLGVGLCYNHDLTFWYHDRWLDNCLPAGRPYDTADDCATYKNQGLCPQNIPLSREKCAHTCSDQLPQLTAPPPCESLESFLCVVLTASSCGTWCYLVYLSVRLDTYCVCLSVLFVWALVGLSVICLRVCLSICLSMAMPEQSEVLSSFRSFCRQAADVSGAPGATGCQSQCSTAQPLQRGRWGDVPVQVQHRQCDVTLFVGRHVERQWLRLWTWVPPAVELSSYSIWKCIRSVWATQIFSNQYNFCRSSVFFKLMHCFYFAYSFKLTVY